MNTHMSADPGRQTTGSQPSGRRLRGTSPLQQALLTSGVLGLYLLAIGVLVLSMVMLMGELTNQMAQGPLGHLQAVFYASN